MDRAATFPKGAEAGPHVNRGQFDWPLCLLSFDVEEHFQIEAARSCVDRSTWEDRPSRLAASIDWLLEQLDTAQAQATFFTLGWVARQHPQLVRRIALAGHEIASHGNEHDRLHRLTPDSFREDLRRASDALGDACGQPVSGYRAPTFSLTRQTAWAVDVLIEENYRYDSSVQPIRHPQYGVPDAPSRPYRLLGTNGWLHELPPLRWDAGPWRIGTGGGGYFRLLPLAATTAAIRQANRRQQPAVLYFHPWEFDVDQPRLPLSWIGRRRTYVGMGRTRPRLQALLGRVRSRPFSDWLQREQTGDWPTYRLNACG